MQANRLAAPRVNAMLTRSGWIGAHGATQPITLADITQKLMASTTNDNIVLGELEVDFGQRDAFLQGKALGLTKREFDLLAHLAQNPGRALSRESVFENVWGYAMEFSSNSLDVYIYRIRKKIEADPEHPKHLLTMRGFGYKLVGASSA